MAPRNEPLGFSHMSPPLLDAAHWLLMFGLDTWPDDLESARSL